MQEERKQDLIQFATLLQINAKLAAASELRSGDEAEDEAEDEYVVTHVNEEVAARYYEFLLKEMEPDEDGGSGPSTPPCEAEMEADQEDNDDARNIDKE